MLWAVIACVTGLIGRQYTCRGSLQPRVHIRVMRSGVWRGLLALGQGQVRLLPATGHWVDVGDDLLARQLLT